MTRIVLLALVGLALPSLPRAQVYLGAGLGYARAVGDVYQGLAMADAVGGQVPIRVEAGYRFGPGLSLGAWFRYAPGWAGGDLAEACDLTGADCSASGLAFGIAAAWTFTPEARFRPWAGLTFGWESLALDLGGGDRMTLRGFELAGVQAGGDFPVGSRLSVGPWLGAGLGRWDEVSLEAASGGGTDAIADRSVHAWLSIGVRGRFSF
jgi:hypothetical protein